MSNYTNLFQSRLLIYAFKTLPKNERTFFDRASFHLSSKILSKKGRRALLFIEKKKIVILGAILWNFSWEFWGTVRFVARVSQVAYPNGTSQSQTLKMGRSAYVVQKLGGTDMEAQKLGKGQRDEIYDAPVRPIEREWNFVQTSL